MTRSIKSARARRQADKPQVNRPTDLRLKDADVARKLQLYGIVTAMRDGKCPSVRTRIVHPTTIYSLDNLYTYTHTHTHIQPLRPPHMAHIHFCNHVHVARCPLHARGLFANSCLVSPSRMIKSTSPSTACYKANSSENPRPIFPATAAFCSATFASCSAPAKCSCSRKTTATYCKTHGGNFAQPSAGPCACPSGPCRALPTNQTA